MELGVKRVGDCLIGIDQFQQEEIRTIPAGKPIAITIHEDRNPANHARFFKFLTIALELQKHYQNVDQLRFALLIKSGLCIKVVSHKDGSVTFVPKSLRWDKMKEPEFRKTFKLCINSFHIMLEEMGIQLTDDELYQLIEFE